MTLPERQSALARYGLAHPIRLAAASGVAFGAGTSVIYREIRPGLWSAAGMFALVYVLWRRGGPARRRENRLYDTEGNRRDAPNPHVPD